MANPILSQAANTALEQSQPEVSLLLRQRESDRRRTVMQTPISTPRYRVMYLKNGKEHRSSWLYREEHAQQGLAMMRAKYGERNAIIYVD